MRRLHKIVWYHKTRCESSVPKIVLRSRYESSMVQCSMDNYYLHVNMEWKLSCFYFNKRIENCWVKGHGFCLDGSLDEVFERWVVKWMGISKRFLDGWSVGIVMIRLNFSELLWPVDVWIRAWDIKKFKKKPGKHERNIKQKKKYGMVFLIQINRNINGFSQVQNLFTSRPFFIKTFLHLDLDLNLFTLSSPRPAKTVPFVILPCLTIVAMGLTPPLGGKGLKHEQACFRLDKTCAVSILNSFKNDPLLVAFAFSSNC